jgi:alpha/beta superfamily hydrolase
VLHAPRGDVRGGAVVCHPHPQYGGDRESAVVVAIAEGLAGAGFAALRFDFGGAGRSEGAYDDGRAEQCDVGAAEAALAARLPAGTPIAIVGYSFGAWVGAMAARGLPRATRVVLVAPPLAFWDFAFLAALGRPVDVVVGDRDQYCPTDAVAQLPPGVRVELVRGADHFLLGHEADVARRVVATLAGP